MKDYVEASEASKDLAPHTLRVEIWNWIILEHYEQLGSKYHNFWSWENGIALKEACQKINLVLGGLVKQFFAETKTILNMDNPHHVFGPKVEFLVVI